MSQFNGRIKQQMTPKDFYLQTIRGPMPIVCICRYVSLPVQFGVARAVLFKYISISCISSHFTYRFCTSSRLIILVDSKCLYRRSRIYDIFSRICLPRLISMTGWNWRKIIKKNIYLLRIRVRHRSSGCPS